MNTFAEAQALSDKLIRLRRDIHAHPELGFQEFRTAQLVADTLRDLGYEDVRTGIGRTGVVAQIGNNDGPTLAIRADMDALPIVERTGLPFASTVDGVMHACGHDGHTAILLGVAQILRQSLAEETWHGNIRLLFQPSEEAADDDGISGASAMIKDGALEDVDAVIALHIFSELASSICYFQDGYSLAAVDSFEAWIYASGGHGAYPHQGTDPLFMLAPILTALYAVPSRRISALYPNVLSLGQIHSGTASNVIPESVYLNGTLRSYQPNVRQQLQVEVENALKIAEALGGSYKLTIHKGYPSMFNHRVVNDWLVNVASETLGKNYVSPYVFGMGGEDFAYMTEAVRGAMFVLGGAKPDGKLRAHHTDIFDIDEACLPYGVTVLAETARRFVTGQLTS
jgi:amidohydrolase